MSRQNCLAILSRYWVGSSPQRRRSDEGVGVKGESERITSHACSTVDGGGARECGKRSKAFGDLCTSDEAVTAQDERSRVLRGCCMAIGVSSRGTRLLQ